MKKDDEDEELCNCNLCYTVAYIIKNPMLALLILSIILCICYINIAHLLYKYCVPVI